MDTIPKKKYVIKIKKKGVDNKIFQMKKMNYESAYILASGKKTNSPSPPLSKKKKKKRTGLFIHIGKEEQSKAIEKYFKQKKQSISAFVREKLSQEMEKKCK